MMCVLFCYVVALLSLEVASLSVNEIDGSVTVCVVLVVGILQRNITAYLSSQNVSAVGKNMISE